MVGQSNKWTFALIHANCAIARSNNCTFTVNNADYTITRQLYVCSYSLSGPRLHTRHRRSVQKNRQGLLELLPDRRMASNDWGHFSRLAVLFAFESVHSRADGPARRFPARRMPSDVADQPPPSPGSGSRSRSKARDTDAR